LESTIEPPARIRAVRHDRSGLLLAGSLFDDPSRAMIFSPPALAAGGNGRMTAPPHAKIRNEIMAWSTPEVREICVGMEVTSYLSAEM
jgi:coenzyme PQQ precursor peptide PqqA